MKIRLALLVFLALPLFVHADSLDIKSGLWEISMSTTITGALMPAAAMENVPSAQRAKIEAAMRARAGKVNTQTHRSCVTQEDLDRGEFIKSEDENCKRNIVEQNARRFEAEDVCGPPEPAKTHITFAAKTPESYTATMDRAQAEGGSVHVEMNGRWIAAACSEADDD